MLPLFQMKTGAFIFFLVLAFSTIQPSLNVFIAEAKTSGCITKPKGCKKEKVPEKKDGCENKRCNPFMGCVSGTFYMLGKLPQTGSPVVILKQQTAVINDNRVIKNSSDCWHPPKLV